MNNYCQLLIDGFRDAFSNRSLMLAYPNQQKKSTINKFRLESVSYKY